MRQQALQRMAQSTRVPSRFRRCAADAQDWPILDELDARINGLMGLGSALVLSSNVGTGKTFALHYGEFLCQQWFWALPYDAKLPFLDFRQVSSGEWTPPRFVDFRDLPGMAINDRDEYAEIIHWRGLLLLDEIGAEISGRSDWGGMILERLLDERYLNELPTIMATNLTADGFKERYGERLTDRLRESGEFLSIAGGSRRTEARDIPHTAKAFTYADYMNLPDHQRSVVKSELMRGGNPPQWFTDGQAEYDRVWREHHAAEAAARAAEQEAEEEATAAAEGTAAQEVDAAEVGA